jgi:hypothetical protein
MINNNLDLAYTVDLLARLTESIETYLEDDRWDGSEVMDNEIKDANTLIKKYYKMIKQGQQDDTMSQWVKQVNKDIREGIA